MDPRYPQNPPGSIPQPISLPNLPPSTPNPVPPSQFPPPIPAYQPPQQPPVMPNVPFPAQTPMPQAAPIPQLNGFLAFSYFTIENQVKFAKLSLRFGLSFVFAWAAYAAYISPQSYLHYVPTLMTAIIPGELFLHIFGVIEVLLALWLLTGKFLTIATSFAFLILFGLTISNLNSFSILFRNVAIIFGSIALAILSAKPKAS